MARDDVGVGVEQEHVAAVGGKPSAQMRLRHRHRRSRIRQHEAQTRSRG